VLGVPGLAPPPILEPVSNSTETFRPSEVDRALSQPPKRGRARYVQAIAAVTVLALGGGAWLKLRPRAHHDAKPVAVSAKKAPPERAPSAPAVLATPTAPTPEPAPAPEPAASAAVPAPSADLTSAFAAALAGTTPSANAVTVTVRVKPAGSIIFERGKRLGTDVVQVNVEPGGKKNLVALLDGYLPRRFSVDSSLNSVTIALRPQGVPASAEPATYGTPSPAPAGAAPAAAAANSTSAPAQAAPHVVTPTPAQPAPKPAAPGKKEAFDPSRDVGSL
jgi:hypothetical protein